MHKATCRTQTSLKWWNTSSIDMWNVINLHPGWKGSWECAWRVNYCGYTQIFVPCMCKKVRNKSQWQFCVNTGPNSSMLQPSSRRLCIYSVLDWTSSSLNSSLNLLLTWQELAVLWSNSRDKRSQNRVFRVHSWLKSCANPRAFPPWMGTHASFSTLVKYEM